MGFKQLLDKATNSELSDPDWESILEIVEEIKSKNVALKTVMKEFRRRLLDSNSTTVYYTLLVLDSVMKNCSTEVHTEILSKEFMNVIKETITSAKSGGKAVDKALELVGEWKVAFGSQADFKAVIEVFFELEREGFHIPETQVASAAFMKKPPEFALQDKCYTCRQEFNRFKGHFRHHCRNCGKSVCTQCSGKRAPLPEYGIEEPTRVCDVCYKKLDSGASSTATSGTAPSSSSDLPEEYLRSSLAKESQTAVPASSDAQIQEQDDIQLAIAMSLNEAENKDKAPPKRAPSPSISIASTTPSAPPPPASTLYASIVHDPTPAPSQPPPTTYYNGGPPAKPEEESDPTLARYLDRNYWEQRKEQQVTPPTSTASAPAQAAVGPQPVVLSNGGTASPLAESVRKTVEMFLARLQEISSVGGNVATDPVILSQYQNLSALQPQLLKQIDEVQQKKVHQQEILHKLTEAKEARVTLNKMRREHQERIKQQEQEQAVLARMQMEQKLALLRQQKAEQFTFQQALQKQRLDDLQTQRSEYERQLAQQREAERLQLIAKEQQVLQHQFGQPGMGYGGMDPGPVESVPFQSLSINPAEQAAPLPVKVEYNPMSESAPPPYQPPMSMYGQQPLNNSLYQPSPLNSQPLTSQPLSYQQPPTMTSMPPSSVVQPQPQLYGSSPSQSALGAPSMSYQQPHSLSQPHSLPQAQPHTLPQAQPHTLPQAQPHTLPQAQPHTLPQAQPHSLPQAQPHSLMQAQPHTVPQPHTLTQPQSLVQPQSMASHVGHQQMHAPHPEAMQQQFQPQPQHFDPAPPQQFVQSQSGFTPNGAHHQPMSMPNGMAPPTGNPEPLLISFD